MYVLLANIFPFTSVDLTRDSLGRFLCASCGDCLPVSSGTGQRIAEGVDMAGRPQSRSSAICGATNRQGKSYQCKLLLKGGRCKFHGGMSTGPKTAEGKRIALEALQAGNRAWRQTQVRL